MATFTIRGEVFEIVDDRVPAANRALAEYRRDIDDLTSREWGHTPGILDEHGLTDALVKRQKRLVSEFKELAIEDN